MIATTFVCRLMHGTRSLDVLMAHLTLGQIQPLLKAVTALLLSGLCRFLTTLLSPEGLTIDGGLPSGNLVVG